MKIIDKLISDGIINEYDKERVIYNYCPSSYGYKDDCSDKVLYTTCKECWNKEEE